MVSYSEESGAGGTKVLLKCLDKDTGSLDMLDLLEKDKLANIEEKCWVSKYYEFALAIILGDLIVYTNQVILAVIPSTLSLNLTCWSLSPRRVGTHDQLLQQGSRTEADGA